MPELLVEHLVQRLVGAGRAGLTDVEVRVCPGHRGDRARDRVDPLLGGLLGSVHVELDERGMAVAGDLAAIGRCERGAQIVEVAVVRRDCAHDVASHRPEGGVPDRELVVLDQHELGQSAGLGEAGLLEDLVGAVRLADVVVLVVDRLLADSRADHDRGDDERKPAEDRELAMARAPSPHAGGDVSRGMRSGHCLPFGSASEGHGGTVVVSTGATTRCSMAVGGAPSYGGAWHLGGGDNRPMRDRVSAR